MKDFYDLTRAVYFFSSKASDMKGEKFETGVWDDQREVGMRSRFGQMNYLPSLKLTVRPPSNRPGPPKAIHLQPKLGGGNSNIFYFQPYLGKIPILTNIFQMGWNHQLASVSCDIC